jgi:hypothetical protein
MVRITEPKTHSIPIVVLTQTRRGIEDQPLTVQPTEAGVYLTKPFDVLSTVT